MQMNVLPAKEETVLHGMIDKQTEIGRWFGIEINEEEQKKWEFEGNHPQHKLW